MTAEMLIAIIMFCNQTGASGSSQNNCTQRIVKCVKTSNQPDLNKALVDCLEKY